METDRLRLRSVDEPDLDADDHAAISALLVAAFPEYADIFRGASWFGVRPDHRLWLEEPDGDLVAHLNFERRLIGVGDREVLVAGVGGVATRPDRQGKGFGRRLTNELQLLLMAETSVGFGYLGCREEVVDFYERVGWHRVYHKAREMNPKSGEWTISEDPTLILQANSPLSTWPREGMIDLRGMWW